MDSLLEFFRLGRQETYHIIGFSTFSVVYFPTSFVLGRFQKIDIEKKDDVKIQSWEVELATVCKEDQRRRSAEAEK